MRVTRPRRLLCPLTLRPPTPESLLRLSCSLPGLPLPDMNLSLAGAGWGWPSSLAWGPMPPPAASGHQLRLARHVQLLSCVGAAQLGLGAHCAHHGGKLRPGDLEPGRRVYSAVQCSTAQYSAVRGRAVLHCTALPAWRVSPVMLYCTTLTYPDTEILCGDREM